MEMGTGPETETGTKTETETETETNKARRWYQLHPRQQSSQLILMPTMYAWWSGYPVGASVYGTNWVVSTLTHSANDPQYIRWHTLDLIAIGCWSVYNAIKVIDLLASSRPTVFLVVALLFAALTTVLYAQMQCYVYESDLRQRTHLSMHAAGVAGTLALLYAMNKSNLRKQRQRAQTS